MNISRTDGGVCGYGFESVPVDPVARLGSMHIDLPDYLQEFHGQ